MSFISNMGIGTGPGSGLRFASSRGRIGGTAAQGVNYPSPFFDIAHTYYPTTVKGLFKWCRYYFLTNPIINATAFKLSEYPITDIIIDHESPQVVKKWTEYFQDHLRYRAFQVECGLDYHVFGNAMLSLGFPFKKFLKCERCNWEQEASKSRGHWIYTSNAFRLTCPSCTHIGNAVARDFYVKNASGVRMLRWNPEDLEISYNPITGEYVNYYNIPGTIKNDITIGRKEIVDSIPQVFLQAVRENKGVIFNKENFFHLKRATIADQDRGWGIPLLLPVLKDVFYLQIMKKAQEAILLEHIVPLRVLFPQPGSGTSDPYCVSPGTLVETLGGLRPASEIRQDDYLRSHTGKWRRVEAVKARLVPSTEKVFSVTADSLSAFPFEVSEDHPILAVKRTNPSRKGRDRQVWVDPEFIAIKDLQVGDYVAYPTKRVRSKEQFVDLANYVDRAVTDKYVYRRLSQQAAEIYEWLEANDDPTFVWGERAVFLAERGWTEQHYATAYSMRRECSIDRMPRLIPINKNLACLVGYFLAEGSLKDGIPTFALHSKEQCIGDEIEAAATSLGFRQTTRYVREDQHSLTVDVQDILLGDLLLGLCGKGFAGKRIPQELAEAEDTLIVEMLRCLFEGDGCAFKTSTNRVALKSANPSMSLEARRLLLSFGLIGSISKEILKEGAVSKQPAFHLNYNGQQAEALRVLFSTGAIQELPWSKLGVLRDDYVLHRIASLKEISNVPTVIGFQMAGDKSFCVAGVATHNTSINLVDWRDHVAAEIARWRLDNNYIPILPLPIGNQTIGGDGKALLMSQEMMLHGEQIMNGMQVPVEFIKGGMSYAGTNVSMRMLENQFIGYILGHKALARFMMKNIAAYLDWPEASIRFKPFKMADDIQRKAYSFQLNQAGKISDKTLLADSDLSQEEEDKIILGEADSRTEAMKKQQLVMADIQGQAQVIMAKWTVKAQQEQQTAMAATAAPGEPGAPEGGGMPQDPMPGMGSPLQASQQMPMNGQGQFMGMNIDLPSMAQAQANMIQRLPPNQQSFAIQNLQAQSPELAQMVQQLMKGNDSGGDQASQPGVDMRPLPEARSPRRAAGTV